MILRKYGFYLDGTELLKTCTCCNKKQARAKMLRIYPHPSLKKRIEIKLIEKVKI